MKVVNQTAFVLLLIFFLFGCGGGGGENSAPIGSANPAVPGTPSVPTNTPAPLNPTAPTNTTVIVGLPDIAAPTASLQFAASEGETFLTQRVTLTVAEVEDLRVGTATVSVRVESADPSIATVGFNILDRNTAVLIVNPSQTKSAGTYTTNVFLRVYKGAASNELIASFSRQVTLIVRPGLSLSSKALELNTFEYVGTVTARLEVTTPPNETGTLTASVLPDGTQAPFWIKAVVQENGRALTVSIDAKTTLPPGFPVFTDASGNSGLAAGQYKTTIEVIFSDRKFPPGFRKVLVPVTLTLTKGLIAPSNQALVLNSNSGIDALSGEVKVEMANNQITTWKATTDANWLRLLPSSENTPATLAYSLNLTQIQSMPHFQSVTTNIILSAPGKASVGFTVSLLKNLPYLAMAGPYGVPVGSQSRIVVGGRGFSQISNFSSIEQIRDLGVSTVQVISDNMLAITATPSRTGTFSLSFPNALGISTPNAPVVVSAASTYNTVSFKASLPVAARYIHDPVRKQIFAITTDGRSLHRYDIKPDSMSAVSVPVERLRRLQLLQNGTLIGLTEKSQLVEIEAISLSISKTYLSAVTDSVIIPVGSQSEVSTSADGKLFPGGNRYFDIVNNQTQLMIPIIVNSNEERDFFSGQMLGSADGSTIMIAQRNVSSNLDIYVYDPAKTNPPFSLTGTLGAGPGFLQTSVDGSRIFHIDSNNNIWRLFDRNRTLLGRLPQPQSGIFEKFALTPDGKKVVVLRTRAKVPLGPQFNAYIEIYDTSRAISGVFAISGLIPVPESVDQNPSTREFALLISADSKGVFLFSSDSIYVFPIP